MARWGQKCCLGTSVDRLPLGRGGGAENPNWGVFFFFWLHGVRRVVFLLGPHVESLVRACGIQFPDQGSNSGLLHWEYRVLATGPPRKSPRLGSASRRKRDTCWADQNNRCSLESFSDCKRWRCKLKELTGRSPRQGALSAVNAGPSLSTG